MVIYLFAADSLTALLDSHCAAQFSHFVGVDSTSRLASSSFGFLLSLSIRRGGAGVLTAFPTVQMLAA